MSAGSASLRSAGFPRPAWPAILTLLTLACVTPPTPADASQPPAASGAAACDGGNCGAQKPPQAQAASPTTTPASTPAAPPATPAATPPAPATTPPSSPAAATPAPSSSPATAHAESPCDTDWVDGQALIIVQGERQDDGTPLTPFRPSDPMYPYDLRGGRFLFGGQGTVFTAVGRFEDPEEAEAALKRMEREMPSTRSVLTTLGPYLVPESPKCRPSRVARGKNPVIDAASWIVEKEGVLLAGSQTQCKNGKLTKKVTVMSCDGMKNLMTDTSEHVCDRTRHVDTCVYAMEPGIVFLKHAYTLNGVNSIQGRALDVRKKKVVFKQDITNGSGLPGGDPENTPRTDFEDVDQDGVPELVVSVPDKGERTSVRRWRQGKFVDTRSP
ncbi:hypothetical protein [Pyxidicoccus caerfyrddinensis]|uniref:hypothetical protein n=1 Tax=Pyxidicoccus caerfyrddinensis TaxID=2709663 RepID=UPI0013DAA8DE|nr:hypothetical protein [Pyxidicoccus caerfyrddinensis]